MKADSPQPPLVKYGMTEEYSDALVERHFTVTCEGKAGDAINLARMMARLPAVQAVLNRGSAPPVAPEPVPVSVVTPEQAPPAVDLRAKLADLRAQHGLT
jgi:hypothetical protein